MIRLLKRDKKKSYQLSGRGDFLFGHIITEKYDQWFENSRQTFWTIRNAKLIDIVLRKVDITVYRLNVSNSFRDIKNEPFWRINRKIFQLEVRTKKYGSSSSINFLDKFDLLKLINLKNECHLVELPTIFVLTFRTNEGLIRTKPFGMSAVEFCSCRKDIQRSNWCREVLKLYCFLPTTF